MRDVRRVVVIGGGVIGFACAFFLQKLGCEVTVLEAEKVGEGCSFGSGGWLCPAQAGPLPAPGLTWFAIRSLIDRRSPLYMAPRQIMRMLPWFYGFWRKSNAEDYLLGTQALAALGWDTFALLDDLAADGVDVQILGRGMMTVGSDPQIVASALAALRPLQDAGYEIPHSIIGSEELHERLPCLSAQMAAGFFVGQHAWVKSSDYVAALSASCMARGAVVLERTPALGFKVSADRIDAIVTPSGSIEADAVLVAAGAWTKLIARLFDEKIPVEAGKGYSFSLALENMPECAIEVLDAHVGCTPIDGRLRIGGTMEFSGLNRQIDSKRVATIVAGADSAFNGILPDVDDVWSGPRPITPDGLPVLDRTQRYSNVFVASGHAMLGVSLAASTGRTMAKFIVEGHRPKELEPFRTTRF